MTAVGPGDGPLLVAVGEPLVQLAPDVGESLADAVQLRVHLGGAEVNVVTTLARLGLPVGMLARVGDDPFGRRVVAALQDAGVDTRAVTRHAHAPTGVYFKDHEGPGSESYYYRRDSAAAALEPQDLRRVPTSAHWLHVSGITSALSRSCAAVVEEMTARRSSGGPAVSFDVNLRPALWPDRDPSRVLLAQARRADVVFVGRDEARALWGARNPDDVRSLLPAVPTLVVKDADRSAVSYRGTSRVEVPALAVEVVEPIGAGDAFAAGYLAARLSGRQEETALRWGHLLAARTLGSPADQCEVPTWTRLETVARLSPQQWGALGHEARV